MVGRHQGRLAALFLAPYLLVFATFRFGPSLAGLALSFFRWGIVGTPVWRGLANYRRLLADPMFWVAFRNTMLFLLYTVPSLVIGSLLIAVLLNQKLRFKNAVRTLAIVPYILIPAVVGVIWNWLYDSNFGILNFYLKALGLSPVEWLTSQSRALPSVSLVVIWSYIGYDVVLFLAGLQGIPAELYEAARIDGADSTRIFFRITLPLLKPIASMVATLTLINAIQIFDQVFVMTNGGPGTSTLTLVQYLYGTAFQNFNLGYGATIGTAILAILILLIAVQSRLFRDKAME